jgi:two-component sensor histidine kinase
MRTFIDGPTAMLKPEMAQAMAVVVHELATNAAKYGALSVAPGQVRVDWSRAANGQLALHSTEAGGPPVNPPVWYPYDGGYESSLGREHAALLARRGA